MAKMVTGARSHVSVPPEGRPGAKSQLVLAVRRLLRSKMATVGLVLLMAISGAAIAAPGIVSRDPTLVDTDSALEPPTREHILGTDSLGRDIASRVVYGGRISLGVGAAASLVATCVGLLVGLVTGYHGGAVDDWMMRSMDAIMSFPSLILAIAIVGTLGPAISNVTLALGVVYAPFVARLVRASTLVLKESEFVTAARVLGSADRRILIKHILPNLLGVVVIQATVMFSWAIVTEASLSFLGLGAQPPTPSWGQDLSEGRRYIGQTNWLVIPPAAAVTLTVLAVNFLGDGLRDALDPRQG